MVRERATRLRALKRPISIRLEPDVLQWLKRGGAGYQTRINELLRKAMERSERRAAGFLKTSRNRNGRSGTAHSVGPDRLKVRAVFK